MLLNQLPLLITAVLGFVASAYGCSSNADCRGSCHPIAGRCLQGASPSGPCKTDEDCSGVCNPVSGQCRYY